MNRNHYLMLGGLIIFCFTAVLSLSKPAIHSFFDLSNSGPVGDTIGGITAPIINLVGAILVYASFRQQLEANRIQKDALNSEIQTSRRLNNFNTTLNIIRNIEEDFKQIKSGTKKNERFGSDAVADCMNTCISEGKLLDEVLTGTLINYSSIARMFSIVIEKILTADIDKEDKKLLVNMLLNFIDSYIGDKNAVIIGGLMSQVTEKWKPRRRGRTEGEGIRLSKVIEAQSIIDSLRDFEVNIEKLRNEVRRRDPKSILHYLPKVT